MCYLYKHFCSSKLWQYWWNKRVFGWNKANLAYKSFHLMLRAHTGFWSSFFVWPMKYAYVGCKPSFGLSTAVLLMITITTASLNRFAIVEFGSIFQWRWFEYGNNFAISMGNQIRKWWEHKWRRWRMECWKN